MHPPPSLEHPRAMGPHISHPWVPAPGGRKAAAVPPALPGACPLAPAQLCGQGHEPPRGGSAAHRTTPRPRLPAPPGPERPRAGKCPKWRRPGGGMGPDPGPPMMAERAGRGWAGPHGSHQQGQPPRGPAALAVPPTSLMPPRLGAHQPQACPGSVPPEGAQSSGPPRAPRLSAGWDHQGLGTARSTHQHGTTQGSVSPGGAHQLDATPGSVPPAVPGGSAPPGGAHRLGVAWAWPVARYHPGLGATWGLVPPEARCHPGALTGSVSPGGRPGLSATWGSVLPGA